MPGPIQTRHASDTVDELIGSAYPIVKKVAQNIVQGTAFTWTNATEVDDLDRTDYRFSTAVRSGSSAFSGTITADGATDQYSMVTVSLR